MIANTKQTQIDQSVQDINLDQSAVPFNDSISSIQWMPILKGQNVSPNIFAVASWDQTVRIYEIVQAINGSTLQVKAIIQAQAPIMSVCWNGSNNGLFIGCSDNTLKSVDLTTGEIAEIGKHNNGVKDIFYVPNQNMILSVSYDKIINCWRSGNKSPVISLPVNNKIFTSTFKYPIFIGGLSNEKLLLFDIKNINIKTYLDCPLGKQSQIQSIAINKDKTIVGIGSIDGRTNLSALNKNSNNQFKLTTYLSFKSNKIQQNNVSTLYPVNTIDFNVKNKKWFLTGGADGNIHFWDFESKNKIKQFSFLKTPVTAAKVNNTGQYMAYGLGNDWHMGPEGIGKWNTKLAVHQIKDNQLKYVK